MFETQELEAFGLQDQTLKIPFDDCHCESFLVWSLWVLNHEIVHQGEISGQELLGRQVPTCFRKSPM